MSNITAISVRGIGKRYHRGAVSSRTDSMRGLISQALGAAFRRNSTSDVSGTFWALHDASFDIARGENVGIVGLNGAGKSTLLKILSRITTPTTGHATITGRMGALLEVGTGFHPELTGRENIFLYAAILGMGRQEVLQKFDAIVDFAEIEEFIDMPVKRYSSGMYVRLAFSVAAHLDPEILLLDEVLAVGDGNFQRKCMEFSAGLERKGATIVVVSHNMFSIKTMCQRVIYLKKGRIAYDGPTDAGLKLYEDDSRLAAPTWFHPDTNAGGVEIENVELVDERGEVKTIFDYNERMKVRIRYKSNRPIEDPNFHVSFVRADGIVCCNYSSELDGVRHSASIGTNSLEVVTPPLRIVSDMYNVEIIVREKGYGNIICAQIGATFHVKHPLLTFDIFGVFHEKGDWRVCT